MRYSYRIFRPLTVDFGAIFRAKGQISYHQSFGRSELNLLDRELSDSTTYYIQLIARHAKHSSYILQYSVGFLLLLEQIDIRIIDVP